MKYSLDTRDVTNPRWQTGGPIPVKLYLLTF